MDGVSEYQTSAVTSYVTMKAASGIAGLSVRTSGDPYTTVTFSTDISLATNDNVIVKVCIYHSPTHTHTVVVIICKSSVQCL